MIYIKLTELIREERHRKVEEERRKRGLIQQRIQRIMQYGIEEEK